MRYRREPRRGGGDDGRLRLLVRGWRLDRNPLRRGSDRAETLILAGLVTAFLAAAPFAIGAAGGYAHAVAARMQHAQLATVRQVDAVTTEAAPKPDGRYGGAALTEPEVTARWTAPDGKAVTGHVRVDYGTPAGARVPVWTDRSGTPAAPPLDNGQVSDLTTMTQVGAGFALALVAWLAWLLLHGLINRRRLAGWDADWLATDSHWTRWR